MRDAFIDELLLQARRDPNVFLVVGDLGYGVVDDFAHDLPDQFLNAGVAEQNMLGAAAGLASTGLKVFVYSIANFPTIRALEQIRNDVCYHGFDVTIVSVGAGVAYGTLGYTHHAVEDVSIMRVLPNLRVLSPGDPWEARSAVHESLQRPGPTYVRLGKNGEASLHTGRLPSLSAPVILRQGTAITIAGTGAIVAECLKAADLLLEMGIDACVVSVPTVSPLDTEQLVQCAQGSPLLTVEEHVLSGGFGAAVLENLNSRRLSLPLKRIGLSNELLSEVGSAEHLRSLHGLDARSIADVANDWVLSNAGSYDDH